jgi:hypothetical protein
MKIDPWFKTVLQVSATILLLSFNVVIVVSLANFIQCVM